MLVAWVGCRSRFRFSASPILGILRCVEGAALLVEVFLGMLRQLGAASIAADEVVAGADDHFAISLGFHGLAHDRAKSVGGPDSGPWGGRLNMAFVAAGMAAVAAALRRRRGQGSHDQECFKDRHGNISGKWN